MTSRRRQKEEARAKRLEEEQARAARERQQRRLRMISGIVVGIVAVAAVGIAIASGGGKSTKAFTPAANGVKLPTPKISDLAAAVKAAGCTQIDTPDSVARSDQNRVHVNPGTKVPYATNPPSYGPHYPAPASDGEYKPGATPATGYTVHALEHGRIEYQYRPGLPAADVKQLEALFNEGAGQWAGGQLLLLFQNTTGMPYDVAATAWGHVVGCRTFSPAVFDVFRDFRLAYTYKAPEQLGTGPE